MIALRRPQAAQADGLQVVQTSDGLSAIHQPGCPAVILDRAPMERFQDWIDGLNPEQLPRTRTILRPIAVPHAIEGICDIAGTPVGYERNCLVGDTTAMAHIFAELMGAEYLSLRLDVVSTNACRKFHIDALTARLICTYRGTGTQYGLSVKDGDPTDVLTVPTGAPMILRGTEWPVTPPCGFLHRSPPIEGTGETRLVLVLDPAESPDAVEPSIVH